MTKKYKTTEWNEIRKYLVEVLCNQLEQEKKKREADQSVIV